jgi:hypothetical protein
MKLVLLLHRADRGAAEAAARRAAIEAAIWEVAESHWAVSEEAVVLACDLSADYLLRHFRRALAEAGLDGTGWLLLAPLRGPPRGHGLPRDIAAWLREAEPE